MIIIIIIISYSKQACGDDLLEGHLCSVRVSICHIIIFLGNSEGNSQSLAESFLTVLVDWHNPNKLMIQSMDQRVAFAEANTVWKSSVPRMAIEKFFE
ncbi:hypothetical protein BpHYR1_012599 [Brachionus plicatilis]|uniref:Uncharacterized protein n=1 Tax=Brachionus plicatilis TaxID=10195 RepID=A0A3M7PFW9_BRAPC|nr:hypothetical protein BpHYR1_012599 [Brachionus plicatilis]